MSGRPFRFWRRTASGCSTVSRINPFNRGDKSPKETASQGNRIAIVAFDDKVEPAEGLKGADFFLPDPQPVNQWALPGGTPEQSIEHVQAGGNLSVAWKRGFGQGSDRGAHVTATPVAANGKIYVMDGEATVTAFDAPMIVVIDNSYARKPGEPPQAGPRPVRDPTAPIRVTVSPTFGEVVVKDLLPALDASFRTIPDRDHRAVAGLRAGGVDDQLRSALGCHAGSRERRLRPRQREGHHRQRPVRGLR